MAEYPRQPQAGNPKNIAAAATISGKHWVRMRDENNVWKNAFSVSTLQRAQIIRDRLNNLFDNYPGTDLDFITPSYMGDNYVVGWSGVQWFENKSYCTQTRNGGTTYENLYAACANDYCNYPYASRDNFMLLASVTADDVKAAGVPAWELALTWANEIRYISNGWNCIKDSTDPSHYGNTPRTIAKLKVPSANIPAQTVNVGCTIYGIGETLNQFTTGNGDIFHTCDLTIAESAQRIFGYTKWIKLTYNGKSVVAKVTDRSAMAANMIDISGGVAYALGIKGRLSSGIIISAP